jgi:hypothetical protein
MCPAELAGELAGFPKLAKDIAVEVQWREPRILSWLPLHPILSLISAIYAYYQISFNAN